MSLNIRDRLPAFDGLVLTKMAINFEGYSGGVAGFSKPVGGSEGQPPGFRFSPPFPLSFSLSLSFLPVSIYTAILLSTLFVNRQPKEFLESLQPPSISSIRAIEIECQIISLEKMSSIARSYIVSASMGAVEALKDHGFARWNYTLRSIHQHLKNSVRSATQTTAKASSLSASEMMKREARAKRAEDSIRKVMELNCFGPSTIRF
ncbi:hypothetical protein Ancab_025301 [Ancistrocladus abbreviatus]